MALHNPQISYEKDRKENGMLSIMEKKENREIYKGVQYCKYRYRRGNGEDVLVYLIIVSPHAPAKLAVSAAISAKSPEYRCVIRIDRDYA